MDKCVKDTKFKKGTSGNPKGKPPGTFSIIPSLRRLVEAKRKGRPYLDELLRHFLELCEHKDPQVSVRALIKLFELIEARYMFDRKIAIEEKIFEMETKLDEIIERFEEIEKSRNGAAGFGNR